MRIFMRRHLTTMLVAVVTAAVTAGGPALAHGVQHALFAHDADKVDGKHAVGAGAKPAARAGKLVATNKAGQLPNNIIAAAGDLRCAGCVGASDLAPTAATQKELDDIAAAAATKTDLDAVKSTADTSAADVTALASRLSAGSVLLSGWTASTSATTMDTFTVTAPADGVLVVTVAGFYLLDADSTTTSSRVTSAYLGLCDTSNSFSDCQGAAHVYYEDPDNASSSNATPAFTLTRTVPVTAGTRTFYVNGWSQSGASFYLWSPTRATAVWMPTELNVTS